MICRKKNNVDIRMDQFESFSVKERKLTKEKLDYVSEKMPADICIFIIQYLFLGPESKRNTKNRISKDQQD